MNRLLKRPFSSPSVKKKGFPWFKFLLGTSAVVGGTFSGAVYLSRENEQVHNWIKSQIPNWDFIIETSIYHASSMQQTVNIQSKELYRRAMELYQEYQKEPSKPKLDVESIPEKQFEKEPPKPKLEVESTPENILEKDSIKENNSPKESNPAKKFEKESIPESKMSIIPELGNRLDLSVNENYPSDTSIVEAEKELYAMLEKAATALPSQLYSDLQKVVFSISDSINRLSTAKLSDTLGVVVAAKQELKGIVDLAVAMENDKYQAITESVVTTMEQFKIAMQDRIATEGVKWQHVLKDKEEALMKQFEQEKQDLFLLHNEEIQATVIQLQSESIAHLEKALQNQQIALQKNWEHQVKVHVDNERAGRLAKLDHLMLKLKMLEKVATENSKRLDHSIHIQKLWAATLAMKEAVNGHYKSSFTKELSVLKSLSQPFELLKDVVSSISTDAAREGIDPLICLESRYDSVAFEIRRASMMPEEGGVLSYLLSSILSLAMFKKEGFPVGNDTESVLARTQSFLKLKDLDGAARELNQLKGWPRRLAQDWIVEARKHLEVNQALQVVEAELGLHGLGII